jgi:uncharacterized protein YqcC (DUF446 family)
MTSDHPEATQPFKMDKKMCQAEWGSAILIPKVKSGIDPNDSDSSPCCVILKLVRQLPPNKERERANTVLFKFQEDPLH